MKPAIHPRLIASALLFGLLAASAPLAQARNQASGPGNAKKPEKQSPALITSQNATPASPKTQPVSVQSSDSATAGAPVQMDAPVITLNDILSAVRNHPLLEAADVERRMANAYLLEKQGAFDPSLEGYSSNYRYNSDDDRGKAKFGSENEAMVGIGTRFGAKVYGGVRRNVNSVKDPASGTGDAGQYVVGVKVPLLRGAGINDKAIAERKAQAGIPLADAEFHQYRLGLLLKASDSYWNWVGAKQAADVQRNLLTLAQQRASQIRQRADLGDLPAIDAIEAEQEAQRRQEQVFKATRDFQKNSFSVGFYLWNNSVAEAVAPEEVRVPKDDMVPNPMDDEAIRQAQDAALKNRPELAQIRARRDITDLDLSLARNQLLPIIDAFAEPGYDPGNQGIGATLKAGVSVMIPLRNRTARGQIELSRLKLEKLSLQEAYQIQQILVDVNDAASQLNLALERYQAAQQAYKLAKQLEEGEKTKFAYGDSTIFLVNQRERSTAEASLKVIETRVEAQQASVRMMAATGQL